MEIAALIREYLPLSPGPVLITTRSRSAASSIRGMNKTLELLPFDNKNSLEVLRALLKGDSHYMSRSTALSLEEEDAAQVLLLKLGGLALGIEQMASYISIRGLTIQLFVKKYNKMASMIHKKSDGMRATHTLDTVWALSFQQIQRSGDDVYKLLGVCAMLSPDTIQETLVQYDPEISPDVGL